jgi:hypothetical protein
VACELLGDATMQRDFLEGDGSLACDHAEIPKMHEAKF